MKDKWLAVVVELLKRELSMKAIRQLAANCDEKKITNTRFSCLSRLLEEKVCFLLFMPYIFEKNIY